MDENVHKLKLINCNYPILTESGRRISFIILGMIAFAGIAYVGILPSLSSGGFSINDMTHDVYHTLDVDHCFQADENGNWYIETDPAKFTNSSHDKLILIPENFKNEMAKLEEVKLYYQKYPNPELSYSEDVLTGKQVSYISTGSGDSKHVSLSVKKTVNQGEIKMRYVCVPNVDYSTQYQENDRNTIKNYLKNTNCFAD